MKDLAGAEGEEGGRVQANLYSFVYLPFIFFSVLPLRSSFGGHQGRRLESPNMAARNRIALQRGRDVAMYKKNCGKPAVATIQQRRDDHTHIIHFEAEDVTLGY